MLNPTQADLDARAAARAAGRAMAASAQVHAPTPADAPADAGASVARVELLSLNSDQPVAVATAEGPVTIPAQEAPAAPAPAPAPAAAAPVQRKPLPGNLPTAVWLAQLAKFHGCSMVGPANEPAPAELHGQHIVTWTANDADARALFPTAVAARLFQLDAMESGADVTVWAMAAPEPESGPLAAETGEAGTTGPETTEDAPAAGKQANTADDAADGEVTLTPCEVRSLMIAALAHEVGRVTRHLNVARWWAIAGWLAALTFGAAAAAMGVALRGFVS